MGLTTITQGKDYNLYTKVTVTSASFLPAADVAINFKGQEGLSLMNETASTIIQYSFNGTTVHGEMDATKDSKTLNFDHRRVSGIWFKITSGASAVIRVEAWAAI